MKLSTHAIAALGAVALALAHASSHAQSHAHSHVQTQGHAPNQAESAQPAGAQPYAGEQARAIKALSAAETNALLAGAGQGYARAAELNRYPGPMHVLELASALDLSDGTSARMRALMDAHKAEARAIGAQIVALERELDALYASRRATKDSVEALTAKIGLAYGRYRAAHLTTHIEAARLLTPVQIARYDELRGYGGGSNDGGLGKSPGDNHPHGGHAH